QLKTGILMLLDRKSDRESARVSSFKELAVKRLNRISDAFSVLSLTMQKAGSKQHTMNEDEQEMLLQNIKSRVCGKCAHREKCIEKEEETDEMIKNLVFMTEKRGWVEQYDVPLYFKNRCLDSVKLVLECNKVFELYRVNQVWENRIAENRRLISGQLKDISGVVKSFSDELMENCSYEEEMEQNLIAVLDGLGIHVENVQIVKGFNNRLTVSLHVMECTGKQVCQRQICTVLKKITGKNFSATGSGCDKERCRLKFKEQENFGVVTGIARIRPNNEEKYGDSYAIIRPEGGKIIVALSDGMGTGEKAAKESGETVSLLEHLLMAGIDREAAIKLINSVLILKSYDESFATLDLLIADLYTGEGEFVKTGGACSYVCREGQVARISTAALPTGILGEMETANKKIILQHGDAVLLASDGLTDVCRDDKWIKDTLVACEYKTAQETADIIMKEALRRVLQCKDDMTAIVIKIFEK
ncbi:MAG: SpoIIE family protein phosphatase, partial [Clostridia bacterium]|nr:SpoIIE family protein phosphatase [Clostridia bacterium]